MYDDECTRVREATQATGGVVVLVLGGNLGNGFSVQGTMQAQLAIPAILEEIARDMRADLRAMFPQTSETKQ
jgi:hypothetical protein